MQQHSDQEETQSLRDKIIGLGEKSIQKSYYPELQRRLSELERFRALLDQSTDCFFLIQFPSGIIEDVTVSTTQLLGYFRNELLGQSFSSFSSTPDIIDELFLETDFSLHKERYVFDTYLIQKGERLISMEVVFSPVVSNEQNYFVAIARDNSTRKQNEEAIRQLNSSLERRVAERTEELQIAIQELESFSYSVSHDLRAPLRSLNGYSQILIDEYESKLDDDGKSFLQRIKQSSEYLTSLIDGLLQISRTNRGVLTVESVNLSAFVQEIADHLREAQPERLMNWRIEPELYAEADPVLIRTMLTNLVQNAWKFSAKNSEACIQFGKEIRDGEIAFYVRDNGIGVDMSEADRLFGPFQRLHSTEEFEGTGIGLAIVARIIHRHGGRVWVESVPGQGACFYFTLPKSRSTQ